MYGRYLHQIDKTLDFQPYSKNKQAIYSINRGELNKKLLTMAEKAGVVIKFGHLCTNIEVITNTISFR